MTELIDLKSCPVRSVLGTLLKDRTTEKNIILATTMYENLDFTSGHTPQGVCELKYQERWNGS